MIKQGLITVGIVLLISGAAHAQTTPQECSAIGDSLQRLTCFDKLFPKGETPAQDDSAAKQSATSNWEVSEERSPIDDSPRVTAMLLPKGQAKESFRRDTPMLVLRCYDNTTTVIYIHGKFSATESPSITYRIGGSTPVTDRWARSDNYQSIGLWRGDKAIPFMKLLKDGDAIAVQTDDPRTEAVFDLNGVEDAVAKVANACNWK